MATEEAVCAKIFSSARLLFVHDKRGMWHRIRKVCLCTEIAQKVLDMASSSFSFKLKHVTLYSL